MTASTPSSFAPTQHSASPMLILATAAAHVDARTILHGPLWKMRCWTAFKTAPRMELHAYDVFCMVFLDRPGAYYRIDQLARRNRGRITADLIIAQLRTYHRLLHGQQDKKLEVYLTNTEIKDWWIMPSHTRSSIDFLLASESMSPPYDYSYVPFLRSFLSQRLGRDGQYRFFRSLGLYLPLLLSAEVELRRSPALSSCTLSYGIFARRSLNSGNYVLPLQPICGEVVSISDEEHRELTRTGADFSILVFDAGHSDRMRAPGRRGREKEWARQSGQTCIVAGGLAFVNHACREHTNMWQAVWEDGRNVGSAQWQRATVKRDVNAGEELFFCYSKYDSEGNEQDEWPCTVCVSEEVSSRVEPYPMSNSCE